MRRVDSSPLRSKRRSRRRDERGVALITTLLLLMLLTGLTMAMAWSARSDLLINGYYRNFRGSFYAADSGINIMKQAMIPMFQVGGALYPKNFAAGTNPLPSPATEQAVMNSVNGTYGSKTVAGAGTGTANKSWPGKYTGNLVFALKSCGTDINPNTCTPFPPAAQSVTYIYSYKITSVGQSVGTENTTLTDEGLVKITAVIPAPGILNFAGYGMFIDQQDVCSGTLVPGTITGPVFTNGSWSFGTGQYTFTDSVGQVGSTVGTSSGCPTGAKNLPSNVTAQQGFGMSQTAVTLPKNSFNQERAVLDGKGANSDPTIPVTQPSPSEMNKVLKNISGTPYPSAAAPSSGVFLPYTVINGKPTFTGGGILVEGNANVTLKPSGANGQVYTIANGSPSVTTTITIDPVANTTTVSSGNTNLTITGVPNQFDPSTGADLGYDTMLYVDGNINSLVGPGQGQAAIQNGTALTVTASGNVTITGDLLYKSEPVYGTPSTPASAGHPLDSLTGNDTGQALGIFTATGDIQMNNGQSNGNLEIDASLATLSAGGTGGLTNIGAQIQTLTIVGGRIQNNIKNINTVQRNVLFDKRFSGNFSPPWFPSTGIQKGNNNANLGTPVITRLRWLNQNNYF